MNKVFVIAEAGSTWCFGKTPTLVHAKQAIRVAKKAGSDCVKFQWCSDPRLMEQRRKVPKGSYDILAWPQKWMKELAAECEEVGIEFMCTVFIPCDVPIIAPFAKRFKVASLEAFDGKFCQACIDLRKPIILSVGACDWKEAKVNFMPQDGWLWENVSLLHCIAAYPAPLAQMNLAVLRRNVGWKSSWDGLSDHSCDVMTGALAVAAGADIIEVHFRLDKTPKDNPDYRHSHDPKGLKQYLANIRKAELMMGDGIKKVEKCEERMVQHRVTV